MKIKYANRWFKVIKILKTPAGVFYFFNFNGKARQILNAEKDIIR